MPPPATLKILCFGNSLTAGYHHYGLAYHPYADTLEPTLRKLVPSLTNLIVDVDGLPGDRVMSPYGRSVERMRERLLRNRATGTKRPYDWVIVMSGTNDLGWGAKAKEVFEGLANLYTETLSLSPQSRILALNIIECAMVSETSQSRRKDLNALIADHKITTTTSDTNSNDNKIPPPPSPLPPPPPADHHDEKEQGKFFVCDLHSAIPYHSMSKEERKEIWDDGLHLTEKGYKRMGEIVGARLAEILDLGS